MKIIQQTLQDGCPILFIILLARSCLFSAIETGMYALFYRSAKNGHIAGSSQWTGHQCPAFSIPPTSANEPVAGADHFAHRYGLFQYTLAGS
jgi:hypothetical protein